MPEQDCTGAGMDIIDFGRYIGALMVTLAILVGGVIAVRRYAPHLLAQAGGVGFGKNRPIPTLRVAETLSIDAKRRVVVIAWDDQHTAVLLGPTGETVLAQRAFTPDTPGTPSTPDTSDTPANDAPTPPFIPTTDTDDV